MGVGMGVVQRRLFAGKSFCRYYGCRASNANTGEALFSGDGASWYFRCQVANSTCCVTTVHYPASLGCLVLNARSKWFMYQYISDVPYRTVYSGFRGRMPILFYSQRTVRHTPRFGRKKNGNRSKRVLLQRLYHTTRTGGKNVKALSPINATIHDFGCTAQADSCAPDPKDSR